MATEHAHLALAVDVINPRDVGQGENAETPDNPDSAWHVLAEGDSWFTIAALPAFHVVDTRNTLVRANPTERGNSNDWINEIHPNLGGYRKIAARLAARINEVLLD